MLRKLDSHKILRLIVENTPWNVLRPDPKVRDISAKIMVSIFICFSTYALKDQSTSLIKKCYVKQWKIQSVLPPGVHAEKSCEI